MSGASIETPVLGKTQVGRGSLTPTALWILLLHSLPAGQDFDTIPELDDRRWQATPQAKFERLLRETRVPAGILYNQTAFRLVYAPRGETSGYMSFRVKDMAEVAGRPVYITSVLMAEPFILL